MGLAFCIMGVNLPKGEKLMKSFRNLAAILALLALLGSQLACNFSRSLSFISNSNSSRSEWQMENRTAQVELSYDVKEIMKTVSLDIDIDLQQGAMTWRLIQPDGKTAWEGGAIEQISKELRQFDAVQGEWVLQVELTEATGKYRIYWFAR
jgi:hypothetical protein